MGKDGKNAERVTTTLTKEQNEALERLAKKHGRGQRAVIANELWKESSV